MEEHIFFNNKILLKSKAKISIESPGFLFGDGIFETIKSCGGKLHDLDLHLERLVDSMKALKYALMQNELFKSSIKKSIEKLLEINNLLNCEANIKIIISRGIYAKKLDMESTRDFDLIIMASLTSSINKHYYGKGVNIISSAIKRTSEENFIYKHKLINYFENIFAKNEANCLKAQEAVFLTCDGYILEGSASNFFIVVEGNVITPSLSQNILPGITRKIIINLCKKNNINISERKIRYEEIAGSDEIFLTNSILEVMPVRKFDNFEFKDNVPGDTTKKLMCLYKEYESDAAGIPGSRFA